MRPVDISRGITLKRSDGECDGAKAGWITPSGRPSNSRPGWKSWMKTLAPSAWIASIRRAKCGMQSSEVPISSASV